MVTQASFNVLLDSGCTSHVVRDQALFRDYAEKAISVDTATCGSLVALGSGDVEFRYPFGDRFVIFTLRGCLYAPTAPMNLLSVGTLVERGMSCLFSPGGIMKVFYPDHHPKFPGLAFSATVINRLSYLLLDFIPPAASSASAFPARVSLPVAVPLSHSVFLPSSSSSSSPSSLRKPNSPQAPKKPSFSNQHYLVIDTTLPSHIFSDRSLFTTYVPSHKLHRTAFGTDIIIEGIGDVHIRVVVSGKSILFRFQDSWHVPSSPHHFLSASTAISLGNQIMIAGRSPRMIFSHTRRLVEPKFPKYMPFTRLDHFIVLKFDIPVQVSASPPLSTQPVPSLLLNALSSYDHPQAFAGLFVIQSPSPSASTLVDLDAPVDWDTHLALNGGADVPVDMDLDECVALNNDATVTSHGGADDRMLMPAADVTVNVNGVVNRGVDSEDQAANLVRMSIPSGSESYDHRYSLYTSQATASILHTNMTCFPSSPLSFSCHNSPFGPFLLSPPPFSTLTHSEPSFSSPVYLIFSSRNSVFSIHLAPFSSSSSWPHDFSVIPPLLHFKDSSFMFQIRILSSTFHSFHSITSHFNFKLVFVSPAFILNSSAFSAANSALSAISVPIPADSSPPSRLPHTTFQAGDTATDPLTLAISRNPTKQNPAISRSEFDHDDAPDNLNKLGKSSRCVDSRQVSKAPGMQEDSLDKARGDVSGKKSKSAIEDHSDAPYLSSPSHMFSDDPQFHRLLHMSPFCMVGIYYPEENHRLQSPSRILSGFLVSSLTSHEYTSPRLRQRSILRV